MLESGAVREVDGKGNLVVRSAGVGEHVGARHRARDGYLGHPGKSIESCRHFSVLTDGVAETGQQRLLVKSCGEGDTVDFRRQLIELGSEAGSILVVNRRVG